MTHPPVTHVDVTTAAELLNLPSVEVRWLAGTGARDFPVPLEIDDDDIYLERTALLAWRELQARLAEAFEQHAKRVPGSALTKREVAEVLS